MKIPMKKNTINRCNWEMKLFIPCDLEEDSKEGKYKKIKRGLGGIEIVLHSPTLEIVEYNPDILNNSQRDCRNLLRSCGVIDAKMENGFSFKSIIFPYGVVISKVFADLSNVNEWIQYFYKVYTSCSIPEFQKDKNEQRPQWLIYGCPLFLIEPTSECVHINIIREFFGEIQYAEIKTGKNGTIVYASNNIVILNKVMDVEFSEELKKVLSVIMALRNLNLQVRIKGKKWLSKDGLSKSNDIAEELLLIHKNCALFGEIASENIFISNISKKIYKKLYCIFDIRDMENQVKNTMNSIDYVMAHMTDKVTSSINETLFATGYLSLLFAAFSFFSIRTANITEFSEVQPWCRFLLGCCAVSSAIILLCITITYFLRKSFLRKDFLKNKIVIIMTVLFTLSMAFLVSNGVK